MASLRSILCSSQVFAGLFLEPFFLEDELVADDGLVVVALVVDTVTGEVLRAVVLGAAVDDGTGVVAFWA